MTTPNLRVWWIGQVGTAAFHAEVRTFREARLLLGTLARYDRHQFDQHVRGDYANAGGLEAFDPDDDDEGPDGSWSCWCDDDGREVGDLTDEEIDALDAARTRADLSV